MDKFNVSLAHALSVIADKLLPDFSGENKVLELILHLEYEDKTKEEAEHTTKVVKVIFWRPFFDMIVAHSYDGRKDFYKVTASHDSVWKLDGFKFFGKKFKVPNNINIAVTQVIEVEGASLNETQTLFTYKPKGK